jgi:hypothetical protein
MSATTPTSLGPEQLNVLQPIIALRLHSISCAVGQPTEFHPYPPAEAIFVTPLAIPVANTAVQSRTSLKGASGALVFHRTATTGQTMS